MTLCYVSPDTSDDTLGDKQETVLFNFVWSAFEQFAEVREEIDKEHDEIIEEQGCNCYFQHLICWN